MAGLFAGSLTSTPALQAAISAAGNNDPALGYSVAYPFGLIAPIMCIYFANVLLKPKLAVATGTGLELREIVVRNPQMIGRPLSELTAALPSGVHVFVVRQAHQNRVPTPEIVLNKDDAISLDCPIRPTLAFLGVEAVSAGGERHLAEADEKIRQNLSRLTSLNFIAAPREAVDRILQQDKRARLSFVPGAADPDLVRKVTERLAGALEAQGFVVAVLPEERLQRTAGLYLLAAGNTTAGPLFIFSCFLS